MLQREAKTTFSNRLDNCYGMLLRSVASSRTRMRSIDRSIYLSVDLLTGWLIHSSSHANQFCNRSAERWNAGQRAATGRKAIKDAAAPSSTRQQISQRANRAESKMLLPLQTQLCAYVDTLKLLKLRRQVPFLWSSLDSFLRRNSFEESCIVCNLQLAISNSCFRLYRPMAAWPGNSILA